MVILSTGGSLGQHYYDFLKSENISAEGLVDASEKGLSGLRELSNEEVEFHQRQRDAHDLWHVLTGYGRDALGELCLLAVTYRLLGNPGLLLIILFGGRHIKKLNPDLKFCRQSEKASAMGVRWFGYRV